MASFALAAASEESVCTVSTASTSDGPLNRDPVSPVRDAPLDEALQQHVGEGKGKAPVYDRSNTFNPFGPPSSSKCYFPVLTPTESKDPYLEASHATSVMDEQAHRSGNAAFSNQPWTDDPSGRRSDTRHSDGDSDDASASAHNNHRRSRQPHKRASWGKHNHAYHRVPPPATRFSHMGHLRPESGDALVLTGHNRGPGGSNVPSTTASATRPRLPTPPPPVTTKKTKSPRQGNDKKSKRGGMGAFFRSVFDTSSKSKGKSKEEAKKKEKAKRKSSRGKRSSDYQPLLAEDSS